MDRSIYVTAAGMNASLRRLQNVALNLANSSTPGFKRTVSRVSAGFAANGRAAAVRPTSGPDTLDLSQGGLRRTGRPLDVAIRGDAFFVVDTPFGRRYTRKGRMYRNSEGELTDAAGHPFLTDRGALSLPPDARQITVTRDGSVLADGTEAGTLRLVSIPDPASLVRESWCLLRNDGSAAVEAVESEVIQGALERSNVKPVREMVGLMQTVRAYEANARVMKRVDVLKEQLIRSVK